MSGRHVQSATGGRARIWLAGLGVAAIAVLVSALAGPAGASSTTVNAQLSLSGLASSTNPLGGSQIGVLPGDKVSFTTATAPTAGLQKLGLSGLVDGVLSLGGNIQVSADFSKLPGGRADTVLTGTTKDAFTFPKGTYNFTWTAQRVTLLGLVPVDLDGNQLASAGIKVNAQNQYVGQIVSSTHPPQGGLSVQVPGVKVAPSVPVLGQFPTLSIPGVNLPTVSISVPDLNPGSSAPGAGAGGSGGGGGGGGGKTTTTTAPAPGLTYEPPAVSVPQMAVPGGSGGGSDGGSNGGGFRLGILSTGSNGQLTLNGSSADGSSTGSGSVSGVPGQDSTGSHKTIDLASSSASPSGELPVLLAILAVITLAMVAGTYARLYLLGRKSSSS